MNGSLELLQAITAELRSAVRELACAYDALPENADDDLAGPYAETARSVVDSQLLKAGLRLAALLNAALK